MFYLRIKVKLYDSNLLVAYIISYIKSKFLNPLFL